MKKGLLVVNEFINDSIKNRFESLYELLIEAFKKYNCELIMKSNSECLAMIDCDSKEDYEFVLFWDKDINLAKHLENIGYKVFNSSNSIAICDDKAKTHLALENHNINMPKTIIAPFTFSNNPYNNFKFVKKAIDKLGLPIIIKEVNGSFGDQVYLANNYEESVEIVKKIFPRSFIFQEFIKSSFGRDYRIEVVGGKALGAVERIGNDGEFRSNVLQGGKMIKANPPKEYFEIAEKACNIIGLDFAGVDVLIGNNNQPILCEINSNVHFKTFFKTTGINLADYIANLVAIKVKL